MKAACAAFLLISCIPALTSATNTSCYNYFLKKNGCVVAAADNQARCRIPLSYTSSAVRLFKHPGNSNPQETGLKRRYDTPTANFTIRSGQGICGSYDTDTQLGVCLWSGAEQVKPTPESAGWLNGPNTANCGKQVYVQRTGQEDTVQYVPVLDGCFFHVTNPSPGCFYIAFTRKLFEAFKPNATEISQGYINEVTWDYNNLDGKRPQYGPS